MTYNESMNCELHTSLEMKKAKANFNQLVMLYQCQLLRNEIKYFGTNF
jgi:hypothetical protein